MTQVVPRGLGARAVASPYKGLSSYAERDAPFFFGRENETAIIAANLVASRLTLVYGASGVGKTSLLRAGVARRLRHLALEDRDAAGKPGFVVVVFPAEEGAGRDRRGSWRDDPIEALAGGIEGAVEELGLLVEAVDRSLSLPDLLEAWSERLDGDVLLILDQFEEYFLYHGDEDGDGTLLAELPRALNRNGLQANVLISIREDAYAKLDRFKGRIPFLYDNYLRVDHLGLAAARAAIERPIEEWNRRVAAESERVAIEPELVDAVLFDVQAGNVVLGQSGRGAVEERQPRDVRIETPFLQLVLERLWAEEQRAATRVLRLETLVRLGGAEQIVRTHLDAAMDKLSDEDREVAARAFRQLVTPSGTKIAHLASDLAALVDVPRSQITRVLEALAAARILRPVAPPPGETAPRYEIFHDVLAPAVLEWHARYVRAREQEELERRAREEREQLEREAREAQRRENEQRRRSQMFRALALAALTGLVLALAALGFAWHEKRVADGERREAESRALAGDARRLVDGRLDNALLLALEARDRADTLEARSALLTAVQQTSGLVRFVRFDRPVQALATGPGGTVAVALEDGTLVLLDRSGRRAGERRSQQTTIESIAFDRRRPLLAAGLGDAAVTLLGLRRTTNGGLELVERRRLQVDQETVRSVAFSPDGRWLAAGGEGGITLWRLDRSGRPRPAPLHGSRATVEAVAFGGGARPLLAAASARGLLVWDLRHPGRRQRLAEPAPARAVAFGADGGLAAAGRGLVWHGSPGGPLRPLPRRRPAAPTALAFDRGGAVLASGHAGGSVTLWHVSDGRPLGPSLRGQGGRIVSVAFDPTGGVLAAASADGTVAVWDARVRARFGTALDLGGGGLAGAAPGRDGVLAVVTRRGALQVRRLGSARAARVVARVVKPRHVAASPDGRWLVVAADGGVATAPLPAGRPLRRLEPTVSAQDVSVARGGLVAAAQGFERDVRRWDAARRELPSLPAPASLRDDVAWSAAITADGGRIAGGYWKSGAVVVWRPEDDDATGAVLGEHGRPVTDLAFDAGGTLLASGDDGGTIALWRLEESGPPTRLRGHAGELRSLAFAPDGRMLASGGKDRTVRLWDPQAGRPLGDPLRLGRPVAAVGFSPDGQSLVAVHGGITVWDTTLWQPGEGTFERVRRRFCAALASDPERPPGGPCERRA